MQSESFYRDHYASILVKIEHCIEYDSPENCASEEEAVEFWAEHDGIVFVLNMSEMNLDMRN